MEPDAPAVALDLLRDAESDAEPETPAPSGADGDDDDAVVLPWWRNPLNIVAIALALVLLSGTIGYVVGNNAALPDPNATDVGFLQDMRIHHEQAVEMSLDYMGAGGLDRGLRTVATAILIEQQLEIGRMIQLLRDFGESEVNDTDVAMTWMGDPVPLERMPGLATDADLQRLRGASGRDADVLFVELMTAHHQAGIHMAQHAADHAAVGEVRTIARQIVKGQQDEIAEMAQLLARDASS